MRPVPKHIGRGRRFPNYGRRIHAEHSLDGIRRWYSVHPFVGGPRPDTPVPRQGPADGPGTFKVLPHPQVSGKGLPAAYGDAGSTYAGSTGYYDASGGYGTAGGGYYGGGTAGYPGGYDFGRPGYNPGGLGGPRSGLGVRPGLGVGGFGPGR